MYVNVPADIQHVTNPLSDLLGTYAHLGADSFTLQSVRSSSGIRMMAKHASAYLVMQHTPSDCVGTGCRQRHFGVS